MNINPRNIQRHSGLGFWLNKDGSRAAEFCGQHYIVTKVGGGWSWDGAVYRTLAAAALAIILAY